MERYDKSALMKIFNMLTVDGCYDTVLFREWSNQVFDSL